MYYLSIIVYILTWTGYTLSWVVEGIHDSTRLAVTRDTS